VKAVQTGAAIPALDGDEAAWRRLLGECPVTLRTLASFPEPLAPSIAAALASRSMDVDALAADCLDIARAHDVTLVEGAGGLLVPLSEDADMASLAARLGATLAVVIRPGLGTLNHTMLTVEAAERRSLAVDLLVCSGYPARPGVVEEENVRFLRRRYPGLPLLILEHADLDQPAGVDAIRSMWEGEPPGWFPQS